MTVVGSRLRSWAPRLQSAKPPDMAAILARGCTESVMTRHAELGDFSSIVYEKKGGRLVEVDPQRNAMRLRALEELAQQQGYSPLLFRGMMDRQLTIYSARARARATTAWALHSACSSTGSATPFRDTLVRPPPSGA